MKHAKVYILFGCETYEKDWIIGVYSDRENCQKAMNRHKERQTKESTEYYKIKSYDIKDCESMVYEQKD